MSEIEIIVDIDLARKPKVSFSSGENKWQNNNIRKGWGERIRLFHVLQPFNKSGETNVGEKFSWNMRP